MTQYDQEFKEDSVAYVQDRPEKTVARCSRDEE